MSSPQTFEHFSFSGAASETSAEDHMLLRILEESTVNNMTLREHLELGDGVVTDERVAHLGHVMLEDPAIPELPEAA